MKLGDAPQLLDRLSVVIDAEVDEDVRQSRIATVLLHHQEGGRLLAAPVASGGLRGGETLDQPLCEW